LPSWAASPGDAPHLQDGGSSREVVFTQYTPLFSNPEILRRLVSPLAQARLRDAVVHAQKTLDSYPLDLAKERFLVYVPSGAPPSSGFALLVFVPPWDDASLPPGWASQLDHYGVIFVTPAHAGNATSPLSRRVPLALSAEENVSRQYPVDRERVYIGGFSGGSRVALRIALAYPDVFHGALLNAGADPIGDERYPLPPRDLFLRFQSSSHLVYVTGVSDAFNMDMQASSLGSMREWCVSDVDAHGTPGVAHEVMSSAALGRALAQLLNHVPPDPARLADCRARVEADLQGKLAQAQALISTAKHAAARKLLLDIDKRYGGLAAARTLELAQSCGCGLLDP
jgi:pimeloyl-ACP methyl ester carboxylesterase